MKSRDGEGGSERRTSTNYKKNDWKTKRNERRLGGKGLSLDAFANAKSKPWGYNPLLIIERRVAAIQAICAAETENLLSRLRLLRSYLSKEQLETPAITFFQKNLPNLSVIRNEKYKVFELQWNDKDGYLPGNQVDGRNMSASLDSAGGLQFSVNSVKKNFLEAANLQIPDFILNEPSENQMPGTRDIFQTPGATGNRLSCGMTPKTLRLPKNGEMLMSVHGSPLGVYKEDNLAAIHESGDGSHDGAT